MIFVNKNPIYIGCFKVSELDDVLKSGNYASTLRCNNADWFVGEVIKMENKMAVCFKNTNEDISMSEEWAAL